MTAATLPAWDGWRLGHEVKTQACVKICWGTRVQVWGTTPNHRREDLLFPCDTDPETLRPIAEAMYLRLASAL